MTYTELKTAVASYMHRTDLTAQIPSFIALAESALFRVFADLKDLELSTTGTTSGGYITLPSDFGTLVRLTVTVGGTEHNLDYIASPDDFTGGTPIGFTQENNKFRLFQTTDGQAYKLYYTASLEPLSDANPTNWLSVNGGDLYMYACCLQAAKWIRDEEHVAALNQTIQPLLASILSLSQRRALPEGSMQIKPRR